MPTLRSLEHDPDSNPKYVCKHCLLFCFDLLETQLEILARFYFGKFWEGRWGLLDPNRSWSPRWTPKSTAGRHTQCFRINWLMVRFLGISPCWLVRKVFSEKALVELFPVVLNWTWKGERGERLKTDSNQLLFRHIKLDKDVLVAPLRWKVKKCVFQFWSEWLLRVVSSFQSC